MPNKTTISISNFRSLSLILTLGDEESLVSNCLYGLIAWDRCVPGDLYRRITASIFSRLVS